MWWLVLFAIWVVSAVYVLHYLPHGWVPHDEGTLAESAQRVLAGQLPHRDFAEIYTGGLSYLNAAAFHWLGTNLLSLRLVLFAVFLLWVPALYYIATRLASPLAAGAVVALAVAWSLPNYSAAMPSWYNLFLATFGTAALFRHLETERRRWLLVAGLCGGLSFLVKSVGLYYIAAVLLYFVYGEQCAALTRARTRPPAGRRWYSAFATTGLLCFVGLLLMLVQRRLGIPEFVHFVIPGVALVALLLWHERTVPVGADSQRFRTLLRLIAPFLVGVCIPIMAFLVPYLRSRSLPMLFQGIFVTPTKRLGFAGMRPPGGPALLYGIAIAVCLSLIFFWHPKLHRGVVVAAVFTLGVVLTADEGRVYRLVWNSMRVLAPVMVLAGAWLLARRGRHLSLLRQQQLALLLSVTALCSLVQFPFSAPVYFFYVAPLVVLTALAITTLQARPPTLAPAVVVAFYLLFAVIRIHPGFIYQMGIMYGRDAQTEQLAGTRGGILVTPADDSTYTQLVAVLREHASGGYTYATPDCPEVYFLAGLRNPTRTIFDFFDEPEGRTARVLSAIDAHHVTAVVLNQAPSFSGPLPADLRGVLEARYPRHQHVGHFVVRWQE